MTSDSSTGPGSEPDWAKQVVDSLESVITAIRSKTSDKAIGVVKILVYALLGAGTALVVMLLATIGLIRLIDVVLPGAVWSSYLLLGGIFFVAGRLVWTFRSRRPS